MKNLPWTILLLSHVSLAATAEPAGEATENTSQPLPAQMKRPIEPTDLPAGLAALDAPRNWGNTFLPKSKPPAREVLSVSLAGLKTDERISLTCLQGLLAREQPRLWLIRKPEDPFWMDWHYAKGHVERFETTTDWTALFDRFRDAVKGAVIPDDELFRGDLLAVNVGACEDLIVASPPVAPREAAATRITRIKSPARTTPHGLRGRN